VSDVPRRSLLNLQCTRCVYGKSAHEFYISNGRHAHLLCTQCNNCSGLIKANRKHLVQSEVHMHAKGTTSQDRHNYTWLLFSLVHPIQRALHLLCQAHGRQGLVPPPVSSSLACLRPWRAWGRRRMHSQRQVQEGPHEQPLSRAVQPTYRTNTRFKHGSVCQAGSAVQSTAAQGADLLAGAGGAAAGRAARAVLACRLFRSASVTS